MNVKVEKLKLDDNDPDLSWLGEFTDTPGPEGQTFERHADDRYGRYARVGEYRYFVATNSAEETGNPESVKQDYERCEAYNRGEWTFVGTVVRVTLTTEDGFVKVIDSPGVWGVESDCGESDFEALAKEQGDEIRAQVYAHRGVSPELLRAAFEAAEWVEKF